MDHVRFVPEENHGRTHVRGRDVASDPGRHLGRWRERRGSAQAAPPLSLGDVKAHSLDPVEALPVRDGVHQQEAVRPRDDLGRGQRVHALPSEEAEALMA